MENGSQASTPEVAGEQPVREHLEMALDPAAATKYRRAAARCNYLSQDRVDVAHASKEVARGMAHPTLADEQRLKRLIRYLSRRARAQFLYQWQGPTDVVYCYTDSDWAGCVRTRRSTTGGAMMKGAHCLGHWSRTQATIALSSGEAELNASLKAGAELLAMRTLLTEMGHVIQGKLYGDSSACSGTLHREGAGRIKHLEIRQLWLQQTIRNGTLTFDKIPRDDNPADSLAKAWAKDGDKHFCCLGFRQVEGS